MERKRRTAEEIIGHLREVQVPPAKGEAIGTAMAQLWVVCSASPRAPEPRRELRLCSWSHS